MTFAQWLTERNVDVASLSTADFKRLQTEYAVASGTGEEPKERSRKNERKHVDLMLLVPTGEKGLVRAFTRTSANTLSERKATFSILETQAIIEGLNIDARGVKRLVARDAASED